MNELRKPEAQLDNPETTRKVSERLHETDEKLKRFGETLDAASPCERDINKPASVEKEISSPFSKENFKEECSFDARARNEYPELNRLKHQCVYKISPMGTPDEQIDRLSKVAYTPEERDYIKDIRDKVDAPTPDTKMQKIIGVDTGDIEKDLDRYLNPRNFDDNPCSAHITGCVAKAEDAAPFTNTPQECFDNLRLDYPETTYKNPNQSVYVVRFKDGVNYDIPYSTEFGGDKALDAPMTGNSFTASETCTIPEYQVRAQNRQGAIVTDGEIYRINPDGSEEIVAFYNKRDKCFELVDEEVKNL